MRPCLEPYLWQKCRLILSVESGRAIDSTVYRSMMGYVNNTTHPHYVYVKISAHHCQDGITFFVFDRSGGKVFFMAPVRGGGNFDL